MAKDVPPVLGIDIGGSGIKGALVDVTKGELLSERHRIPTPQPATPEAVAETVAKLVKYFDYSGQIGCTFPAIVQHGVVHSAANVDKSWIGQDADALFSAATHCDVHMLNDADAAGVAEMAFGAGRDNLGVVFMLTFGTGIGSAVFTEGILLPNTELGHIELDGREAEPWASAKARKEQKLGWKKWSKRVSAYLTYLSALFSPDLFIIGGGVSKKADKFFPYIQSPTPFVAAELRNEAGIVGAAYTIAHLKHR
jgi:polyphosphate glucokinase